MAIVGPITSIALGIIFLLAAGVGVGAMGAVAANPAALASRLDPLTTLLLWLGPVNLILGIFNLVPGFPLDGGRVLRSILWAATKNLRTATRWASWIGQAIAWLMIVSGIAMIFGTRLPFFGSGVVSGVWLAVIGWFLSNAAIQSYQQLVVHDMLEDVPVTRLMRTNVPAVAPTMTISTLVDDYILHSDDRAFPVLEGDRPVGDAGRRAPGAGDARRACDRNGAPPRYRPLAAAPIRRRGELIRPAQPSATLPTVCRYCSRTSANHLSVSAFIGSSWQMA